MLATAPSIIGAPFDAGRHRKPPNLSAALTANCLQMWCWSWAKMLTHSGPMSRIVRQLVDVRAGQNEIYGGSTDTDVTDWQVKPHFRVPSLAVMTAAIPVENGGEPTEDVTHGRRCGRAARHRTPCIVL